MSKRIGVLVNNMGGSALPYERKFALAVSEVAERYGNKIIYYTGGFYNAPERLGGQQSYILDLAKADNLDGIIALSSLIAEFCSTEEITAYYESFAPVPVVSVGIELPGIPSVLINNYDAMSSIMNHLFSEHNPENVVYIGGPPEGYEAQERLRAFTDAMNKNGRDVNPDLMYDGFYLRSSGSAAALDLLKNKKKFDTVVCANDETALGFMSCLAETGLHAQRDYIITGFDDIDSTILSNPPLTTVRQNIYQAGKQGAEVLQEILEGKPVPETRWIPTTLVVRDSCGCSRGALPELNDVEALKEGILATKREIAIRDQEEYTLSVISEGLINTYTDSGLCSVINDRIPALREITRLSFCRYRRLESGTQLQPFLQYTIEDGAVLLPDTPWYDTSALEKDTPAKMRLLESLHFGSQIFGVIIFEFDSLPYFTFSSLRKQISQTMQHIKTFSKIAELNEELSIKVEHLYSLRTIDQAITGAKDRNVLLSVLMSEIMNQQRADAIIISLIDPPGSTPVISSLRGVTVRDCDENEPVNVETVYLPDISPDSIPDIGKSRQRILHERNFKGYCRIPLSARGEINGLIELFTREPLPDEENWRNFLETLAGQAAIAIENTILMEDLKRVNTSLREAYNTTIEGWSRALDLRDQETEGHCTRVAQMSVELGRHLGLDEHDIENLYRGALLHDIGKVGIPDAILLKPGPLTDEERFIMNKHPDYAHNLLAPIEFLLPALSVPWCHHEKWDGTGYPQGLKGKEIPLFARIFAVIDVWDALSSERPYRGPWEHDRIVEYIRSNSGTHFDPDIVRLFLEIHEKKTDTA